MFLKKKRIKWKKVLCNCPDNHLSNYTKTITILLWLSEYCWIIPSTSSRGLFYNIHFAFTLVNTPLKQYVLQWSYSVEKPRLTWRDLVPAPNQKEGGAGQKSATGKDKNVVATMKRKRATNNAHAQYRSVWECSSTYLSPISHLTIIIWESPLQNLVV